MTGEDRKSEALEAELITDPEEKARREARNGLLQFDLVDQMIEEGLDPERKFRLRASKILALQRAAIDGISLYAGNYRPAGVEIKGSKHEPVGAHLVPELVEDLCDYVNDNWTEKSPVHLASYVMWRLNWVHPFVDGNGRTSRALSYLILCVRLGSSLPGNPSVPDQISANKDPYYKALEAADAAFGGGSVDVSEMENLIGALLAKQLVKVHQDALASGKS